jgi:hypothetical protein
MLVFIDETWQKINGTEIGALGAVVIPQARYNNFCRAVYAIKRDVLGASEFTDSEIKGQTSFAKSAFKRQAKHGDSYWLTAATQLLDAMRRHRARAFVIWSKNPELLTLRNPHSTALSKMYRQLLYDLRAFMINEAGSKLATINFDQREHRDDAATARAVANFLIRTSGRTHNRWDRHFITVPSFTASSTSPGLQAADVVAYLGAHRSTPSWRPELQPWTTRLLDLRYEYERPAPRSRGGVRTVRCWREAV